jgi:hypothetical protein
MTRLAVEMMLGSILLSPVSAGAAEIPPEYPNAVVALGSMKPFFVPGQPCSMQWTTEGTGFLYGYLVQNDPNPKNRKYEVYLVTNRHVIEEHAATEAISRARPVPSLQAGTGCTPLPLKGDSISVRMNPVTSSSLESRSFDLPIKDWVFHPNKTIDVAVINVNPLALKTEGLLDMFFTNDEHSANRVKLQSLGVSAGDGVFVLGFPMNLAGIQRNYVIVRQGCIARIADMLDGRSSTYLLDAFVFPGNSGSPVVLRPTEGSIAGTPPQPRPFLIGFVRGYQPYQDVAISPQTGRTRISFEENSGLADVLPVDYIDEAIVSWHNQRRP